MCSHFDRHSPRTIHRSEGRRRRSSVKLIQECVPSYRLLIVLIVKGISQTYNRECPTSCPITCPQGWHQMRPEGCILDGNFFVSAPLEKTEPEEEWVRALDSGSITTELYEFYRKAHYVSFGSAPKFLADPDNVLFSYFGMMLRSLMEAHVDSAERLRSFIDDQKIAYDAGKKMRGETWDPGADVRARRHFRGLLIALQSNLDAL